MQRRKGAAKRAAAATGGAAGDPAIDESMEPEPEEEEDTSTRGKARLTMMGAGASLSATLPHSFIQPSVNGLLAGAAWRIRFLLYCWFHLCAVSRRQIAPPGRGEEGGLGKPTDGHAGTQRGFILQTAFCARNREAATLILPTDSCSRHKSLGGVQRSDRWQGVCGTVVAAAPRAKPTWHL